MSLFSRGPHRLEDPVLIEAAVRTLCNEGFERRDIEEALIRTAPVDLDILAQCLALVLRTGKETIGGAIEGDQTLQGPAQQVPRQRDTRLHVRRAA